jgi:hypothetical protein
MVTARATIGKDFESQAGGLDPIDIRPGNGRAGFVGDMAVEG